MAQYPVRAGIDQYAIYGEETAFGVEAGTIASTFGIITDFSPRLNRNAFKTRGQAGVLPSANTETTARDAQHILRGRFDGSISISFIPLNFRWLKLALGTESGSGTEIAKYNYPRATASTNEEKLSYFNLPSFTISSNYFFGGTNDNANKAWKYLGCKINSVTIRGTIGEPISVTLDIIFSNVVGDTTLDIPVALPANEPFHFTGSDIEYPTGTSIPEIVESFELGFSNGLEALFDVRSDVAQEIKPKERDWTITITLNREGTAFIDDFMGGATSLAEMTEIATITTKFAGDTNKELSATYLRAKLPDVSESAGHPNIIKDTLNLTAEVGYFQEQTDA